MPSLTSPKLVLFFVLLTQSCLNAGLVVNLDFENSLANSGSLGGSATGSVNFMSGFDGTGIQTNSGSTDEATMSGIAVDLSEITIAAWVKVAPTPNFNAVWGFETNSSHYINFQAHATGTSVSDTNGLHSPGSNLWGGNPGDPIIHDGEWHHIAWVGSNAAGMHEYFIDGQSIATNTWNQVGRTLTAITIGASLQPGEPREINQMIDSFQIYDTALSATEIQALATAVPEPTSLTLFAVALSPLLVRRRR